MTHEHSLLIVGSALLLVGLLLYYRSERELRAEQRQQLSAALASPPPVVTALYIIALLGCFGVLLVGALVLGFGPRIVILAPACVCVATLFKIFAASGKLDFGQSWRSQFLLGLTLTGIGLSLDLAALASNFLI